jgi:mRNA interferase YafQ
MRLSIIFTSQMKRDYKRMERRGKDMRLLSDILDKLACGERLERRHNDHKLKGSLKDVRECHIEPDWLLVYKVDQRRLILTALATGTHDDVLNTQ